MLGLRRNGLKGGSGLQVSTCVFKGVGRAGDELNKAEDRSFEVDSIGEGFLLGVSTTPCSSATIDLGTVLETSSVELVGD